MEAPERIFVRKVDEDDEDPYWWEGAECGGVRINDSDAEYVRRDIAVGLRRELLSMVSNASYNEHVVDATKWLQEDTDG